MARGVLSFANFGLPGSRGPWPCQLQARQAALPSCRMCRASHVLPSSIAEPRYSQLIKSRDPHRDRKKLRVIPTMKAKSLCCDTNKSKLSLETLKQFKTCSKHTSRETCNKVCLQGKECGSMALWGSCNRWSNKWTLKRNTDKHRKKLYKSNVHRSCETLPVVA